MILYVKSNAKTINDAGVRQNEGDGITMRDDKSSKNRRDKGLKKDEQCQGCVFRYTIRNMRKEGSPRVCDYIVTPDREELLEIKNVELAYINPADLQYQIDIARSNYSRTIETTQQISA